MYEVQIRQCTNCWEEGGKKEKKKKKKNRITNLGSSVRYEYFVVVTCEYNNRIIVIGSSLEFNACFLDITLGMPLWIFEID